MGTVQNYLDMLRGLLPKGVIWRCEKGSTLSSFLTGNALELTRLDSEANRLIAEIDPQSSTEAIEDWERVLGLPDACGSDADTLAARRAQVLQKLMRPEGQHESLYIRLAETLGYAGATVQTFAPFCVETSCVEDLLNDAPGGARVDYSTTPPTVTESPYDGWKYVWLLQIAESPIFHFAVEDSVAGDYLATWGNERLECIIRRASPAHTHVLFGYGKLYKN